MASRRVRRQRQPRVRGDGRWSPLPLRPLDRGRGDHERVVRRPHDRPEGDRGGLGGGPGNAERARAFRDRLVGLARLPGGDPHAHRAVRVAATTEGGGASPAADRLTNLYRVRPVARRAMDYEALLKELYGLERFGIKLGLDVIRELLRRIGDPHESFPAIHVTGTNGKGSVCAYLASILTE